MARVVDVRVVSAGLLGAYLKMLGGLNVAAAIMCLFALLSVIAMLMGGWGWGWAAKLRRRFTASTLTVASVVPVRHCDPA